MSITGLVLLMCVGLSQAVPLASYPIVDSPNTQIWKSLSEAEQKAVLKMAFGSNKNGPLRSAPLQLRGTNTKLESPEVQHLAREIMHYTARRWVLTPEQINEIAETGKLCNARGECIDFWGDWGHGCCPF